MEINEQIEEYYKILSEVHYPRWNELPDFDLYMDQVISLIERYLGFLQADPIDRVVTPNMINNYVKQKMIPKPNKKCYNKVHLAYLISIISLKQVLTISEIKQGIMYQANISGDKDAYNNFCDLQERAILEALGLISDDYDYVRLDKIKDSSMVVIYLGTRAFASKIIASYIAYKNKDDNL